MSISHDGNGLINQGTAPTRGFWWWDIWVQSAYGNAPIRGFWWWDIWVQSEYGNASFWPVTDMRFGCPAQYIVYIYTFVVIFYERSYLRVSGHRRAPRLSPFTGIWTNIAPRIISPRWGGSSMGRDFGVPRWPFSLEGFNDKKLKSKKKKRKKRRVWERICANWVGFGLAQTRTQLTHCHPSSVYQWFKKK